MVFFQLSDYALMLIRNYGLFIILLYCFLGEFPFFGLFFQEQTLVLVAGFLSAAGMFGFAKLVLLVTIFTFFGDFTGFLLGKYIKDKTKAKRFFFIKKEHLLKSKRLIKKHSWLSIIIGKFTSPTRVVVPMLVGASGLKTRKYIIYSIIASFIWSFSSILTGFITGKGLGILIKFTGSIITVSIISFTILLMLYLSFHYKKLFKKSHMWLIITSLVMFALFLYIGTIVSYSTNNYITSIDTEINQTMPLLWSTAASNTMFFFTMFFSPVSLTIFAAILVFYFYKKKRVFDFIFVLMSFLIAAIIVIFFKYLFHRLRPQNYLYHEIGYSYPSAHACFAALFFSILMFYYSPHLKHTINKIVLIITSTSIVLFIGFSRIYLNVHWFSDVLGGYIIGVFSFILAYLIIEIIKHYENSIMKKFASRNKVYS